jgi:alkanesulfonate monooxygenase SsuD/methylene tetrahydromethanopterin reductase-like flavin-dependent oxidoreductase (luciferase family)
MPARTVSAAPHGTEKSGVSGATSSGLRFGVLVLQDADFGTLRERWRRVEELGFDYLFVADHARHARDPSHTWFDGWSTLVAMALETRSIRIGPLVANPILRRPTVLAKAAAAVDHFSMGRLELALGQGVERFDHDETGTPYWSPAERAARFREYVEVVDGALRSWEAPFSFKGRHHRARDVSLAPAPVQRPRPPITVGGRSPTVLRVAAERADCWNTFGLLPTTAEEVVETTRRQNRELDDRCAEMGRDPADLRRSLVMWSPLDPWSATDCFERLVDRFRDAGIAEFIVMWPPDDRCRCSSARPPRSPRSARRQGDRRPIRQRGAARRRSLSQ